MKNRKNNFRITALLLTAAMTVAMLCGCDANTAPTEPEDTKPHYIEQEETEPHYTEPEATTQPTTGSDNTSEDYVVYPAMEPYLGTWVLAQETANYTEKTITFHPSGTAEYDGATYKWKLDPGERFGSIYLSLISVNDPSDTAYREDKVYISTYTTDEGDIYLYQDGYYFHEDYLAQFEKVTLTAENICDYVHVVDEYLYFTDDLGRFDGVRHDYSTRFKEGLGLASWCVGELTHEFGTYNITYYTEPGTEKLGDLTDSYEYTALQSILNIDGDMEHRDRISIHFNDQGESKTEITLKKLVGADPVIGVAYVPKN